MRLFLFILLFFLIYLFIIYLFIIHPILKPQNKKHIYIHLPYLSKQEQIIPKKIWCYWDQGFSDASPIVKLCQNKIQQLHPDWNLYFLDKNTINQYLNFSNISFPEKNYYQKKADYIRLALLEKYGGIWVDASIICTQSFDWIYTIQSQDQSTMLVYYADHFTVDILNPVLENWFIAAIPHHPFIKLWKNDFQHYLTIGYEKYMDGLRKKQINLQRIDNPKYLTMHVSALHISQSYQNDFQISYLSSYDSPFYIHQQMNWNIKKIINYLKDTYVDNKVYTIIKLRKGERSILDKYYQKYKDSLNKQSLFYKSLLQ